MMSTNAKESGTNAIDMIEIYASVLTRTKGERG